MYKINQEKQISLTDFNQPLGLQLNPDNRWIQLAETVPWDKIEIEYAKLFPSKTGNTAKPLRLALGALILQKYLDIPTRNLFCKFRKIPIISTSSVCQAIPTKFRSSLH